MHFPLFLCLYESFWKGFESNQSRFTLLVIKCVCFSLARRKVSPHVSNIVNY